MAYNRQAIIAKIAVKGVITPYEAIYLQYLNNLHIKKQVPDVEKWKNPYIAVKKVSEIYSQYELDRILTFQTNEEENQYEACRWAANLMMKMDACAGELAYKAILLLNEILYLQNKYTLKVLKNTPNEIPNEETIFEFSDYSQVHQQVMTFTQLVKSFTDTFNFLLANIDNILTLNCYLRSMVDKEEYSCLKFLSIVLSKEKVEIEDDKGINITHLCYQQIVNHLVESNHEQFCTFMKWQLQSFSITLNGSFPERSLAYVKESLMEISDVLIPNKNNTHQT